jgi:hypothetical protein
VLIVNPTNNQVLAYDSVTQLWKNATNAPDGVTSITATAPLTGGTITSTGSIGLDQTALSLTRSQISDFTSGTVTSAGTAQQAGTAVYSVNSGTAVYATTSGTAVNLSGTITKSQVSDFTSGTVASAGTSQQSGTAVFANTSGTATYATTSGTAVTISGDITKSQVSDFTSGTVASASTAQQAGTAVYALTSGTATYADTSGTAVYSTNSGTAVFATNASTAVTISGSIAQSQVTNLTTDLANTAKLNIANTFSVGGHVINNAATGTVPIRVNAITGQTANQLEFANTSGAITNSVNGAGTLFIGPVGNQSFISGLDGRASILNSGSSNIAFTVRGASGQANDFFTINNVGGTALMRVNLNGSAFFGTTTGNYPTFFGASGSLAGMINVVPASAAVIPIIVRGAASQSVDLFQLQNSAGVNQFRVDQAGLVVANALGVSGSPSGISYAYFTTPIATAKPVVIRGAASQSVNLTDWQRSDGQIVSRMAFDGGFITTSGVQTGAASFVGVTYNGISNPATFTTLPSLVVTGITSQTGDLQQWRNESNQVLNRVLSNSNMLLGNSSIAHDAYISFVGAGSNRNAGIRWGGDAAGSDQFNLTTNTTDGDLNLNILGATRTFNIRGAASQSANLQEWQSSAGSILARVDSVGDITARVQRSTFAARFTTTDPSIAIQVNTGAASQTGDFFQTQTSTGTVMQRLLADGGATFGSGNTTITSTGSIFTAAFRTSNDWFQGSQANSGGRITMTRQTAADSNPGANNARLYFRDGTNAGTLKLVVRAGATGAETTILDNIPQ